MQSVQCSDSIQVEFYTFIESFFIEKRKISNIKTNYANHDFDIVEVKRLNEQNRKISPSKHIRKIKFNSHRHKNDKSVSFAIKTGKNYFLNSLRVEKQLKQLELEELS